MKATWDTDHDAALSSAVSTDIIGHVTGHEQLQVPDPVTAPH